MNQIERNLIFWQKLVGLPRGFPNLPPLMDDEIRNFMVIDTIVESDLLNAISSRLLTAVVVQEGCGLTTLFRYLFNFYEETSSQNQVIPVSIDLEANVWSKNAAWDILEREIKTQVLRNLITREWVQKLQRAHYYEVVGYQEDMDFFAFQAERRQFLKSKRPGVRKLNQYFPFIKRPLEEFINYLLESLRIQTVLFFHFPRKISQKIIQDLLTAEKFIFEGRAFQPAALRKVYFVTPAILAELKRTYSRNYYEIPYPSYTKAQIVAMLKKRYRPSQPNTKGVPVYEDLGSVFDQLFVHMAWAEERPLDQTVEQIGVLIKERLDCKKEEVEYCLSPTPEQKKTHESAKFKLEIPKRKKFVRKRYGE